jgi:hypothetical protein
VNDDRLWVARQVISGAAVELSVAQDKGYPDFLIDSGLLEPREIIAHLPDQRHGSLVFEQGIRAL